MARLPLWPPLAAPPTENAPAYRVEHRDGCRVHSLGELRGVSAHHATLEPFVSALLRNGEGGELLLVDAATGAVAARRRIRPYRAKAGDRFRQLAN